VDFKQLVNGKIGETVIIPAVADVGGGFSLPRLETPPLPIIFAPTTPDVGDGAPARVLIHDNISAGLLYTNTFNTPSPNWYQVNAGLTQTQYLSINKVVVCPNGAIYVGNTDTGLDTFLARAPYIGGVFVIIEDYTSITTKFGSTDNPKVPLWNCNELVGENVAYAITIGGAGIKTYVGAGTTFVAGFAGAFAEGIGFASISYAQTGQWMISNNGRVRLFPPDMSAVLGSVIVLGTGVDAIGLDRHIRVGSTGKTIHWDWATNGLVLGEDNCTTFVTNVATGQLSGSVYTREDQLMCDQTGSVLMSMGATTPKKSTDGGYSWSIIANLTVLVQTWFDNVITDSAKWVSVSDGGYVYYTSTAFNTYPDDKRGNLPLLSPLAQLDIVKILP